MQKKEKILRQKILKNVEEILKLKKNDIFIPIKDKVQYAGSFYDQEEIMSMINAILDGWLGVGKNVHQFESKLSRFLGARKSIMVNSGSSANLLAISSLCSTKLSEKKRLKPGDEVITPAVTFPTTLNPIIQNGLKPVFIDVKINTYNVDPEDIRLAISEKTRAIIIPHTLGNPNEMNPIVEIAKQHNLFLIEDSCDALGSKYNGKYLGTFGDFGTFSFFPAHHITTGEGGAIIANDITLHKIAVSLRDWGRECVSYVCDPLICLIQHCPKSTKYSRKLKDNDLPEDYDERYTYTNIGYNLKPTEIQGAMGTAQLDKLSFFIKTRNNNFKTLYNEFQKYENIFYLPESPLKSEPSWFAFPLTIKEEAPFTRAKIMQYLVKHNIEAKLMFAGNIIRQPAYTNIEYRSVGSLSNSDYIMRNTFFIGVYPGLNEEKIYFMIDVFRKYLSEFS